MTDSTGKGEVTKNARTLVLCFDGTANEYSGDNTNVVKFFSLLKKDDLNEQICYYQAGIGTFFNPGVVSPVFQWGAKILDEAIAWYLNQHVMDGYRFLMQNYCIGDKICLFGFSRGAYTARALAGMLFKVGLLPRDNDEQIAFAYKLYQREDDAGIQLSAGFKQTFSFNVTIEFIGVWDTVSSVGIVMGKTLPFTNSNQAIKTFRHALSLDEHRAKFRPNYYHYPAPTPAAAAKDPEQASGAPPDLESGFSSDDLRKEKKNRWSFRSRANPKRTDKVRTSSITVRGNPDVTDVLEVWFAGCHSDVGGGAVSDDTVSSLANITLRWMVREIILSQCGIRFDVDALQRLSIPYVFPDAGNPNDAMTARDKTDAVQPLHDQLKAIPLWWLLEIIPLHYSWQDDQGVWHTSFTFNMGRGRNIFDEHPNFHSSVKTRMQDTSLKYTPRAKWTAGTEVYID